MPAAQAIPYRGVHMLRYDPDSIGHYEGMPVVLWVVGDDGMPVPLGVYPFPYDAILDDTQNVHDVKAERTFSGIGEWVRFKDEGEPGKPVGRTTTGKTITTPSLRELGVSGRAAAPLERIGIKVLSDLQKTTKEVVAGTKGVSTDTLALLIASMTRYKLLWADEAQEQAAAEDDDDDEDIM